LIAAAHAAVEQYSRTDFGALRLTDDKAGRVAALSAARIRGVNQQSGGAAGLQKSSSRRIQAC
jgi:hypothetical protein